MTVREEREECARVAETAFLQFGDLGFSKHNSIREKFGRYVAGLIRKRGDVGYYVAIPDHEGSKGRRAIISAKKQSEKMLKRYGG